MNLTPLASRTPAVVRDALVRRGMDAAHADAAARGLSPAAIVFDDVSHDHCRSLVEIAQRQGLESLTGNGWVLLAGSAARLVGLARPGAAPLAGAEAEALTGALRGLVEPPDRWVTRRGTVKLDRPVVAGILNVTPDSFSDGGRYLEPDAALAHAEALVAAGADMLDVGAESTRPGGATPVTVDEEWHRLAPVLERLERALPGVPVSIDTVKAEIAERALHAGAWAINDVSGLRLDPHIADVCASHGAGLVLMHSRGSTDTMASYERATYEDVAGETAAELGEAVERATHAGMARERIVLDPGLGFAKTPAQSFAALRGMALLVAQGFPVMVGPSRKRFLGVTDRDVGAQDQATAVVCVAACQLGATLFRVHNASIVREALDLAHAVGRA